jgi:hypothetical protein
MICGAGRARLGAPLMPDRDQSIARVPFTAESSKRFVLRYGGETIGLFDTALECASAYQMHRALTRSNGYSRREPRYRVSLAGERVTVGRLLVLARAKQPA